MSANAYICDVIEARSFQIGEAVRFIDGGPIMVVFAFEGEQIACTYENPAGTRRELRLPSCALIAAL